MAEREKKSAGGNACQALGMQRILSVNVILHARAVSDARFNVVVTQNEKSTLSRIIFLLLHYYRMSARLQVSSFVHIDQELVS